MCFLTNLNKIYMYLFHFSDPENPSTRILIGAMTGGVFITIIVIIVCVISLKKRYKHKYES